VDPTRDLLQILDRRYQSRRDAKQLRAEVLLLGGKVRLRRAHRQSERDEPLLRAIVQVALDPPASLVRCCDDASARCCELGLAFRVRDRGRDELGELLQSLLRVAR